jgi:hypothetical protein
MKATSSGMDKPSPRRLFITTDLFAMGAKAYDECEACRHYPHFWKYNTAADGTKKAMLHINGDPVPAYNLGLGLYEAAVGQYSDLPGGQHARLASNLRRAGVHELVSVNMGQHIPYGIPYEMVFSDATHDLHETRYNFPKMVRGIRATTPPGRCRARVPSHKRGTRKRGTRCERPRLPDTAVASPLPSTTSSPTTGRPTCPTCP